MLAQLNFLRIHSFAFHWAQRTFPLRRVHVSTEDHGGQSTKLGGAREIWCRGERSQSGNKVPRENSLWAWIPGPSHTFTSWLPHSVPVCHRPVPSSVLPQPWVVLSQFYPLIMVADTSPLLARITLRKPHLESVDGKRGHILNPTSSGEACMVGLKNSDLNYPHRMISA